MKITPIETGCKIQLPSEWVNEFGLEKLVALEKTSEGILVHLPPPPAGWDEIFSDKLPMEKESSALDLSEVSGDDFLF